MRFVVCGGIGCRCRGCVWIGFKLQRSAPTYHHHLLLSAPQIVQSTKVTNTDEQQILPRPADPDMNITTLLWIRSRQFAGIFLRGATCLPSTVAPLPDRRYLGLAEFGYVAFAAILICLHTSQEYWRASMAPVLRAELPVLAPDPSRPRSSTPLSRSRRRTRRSLHLFRPLLR